MAEIAGKIMPLPRGEYVSISEYRILDMVRYDRCLWIAKRNDLKGVTPSKENSDSWMLALEESDVNMLESKVIEIQTTVNTTQDDLETITAKVEELAKSGIDNAVINDLRTAIEDSKSTASEALNNVTLLDSKVTELKQLIGSQCKISIGETEPTDCNVLWYNTNYKNNVTDTVESVTLNLGEVTDDSMIMAQVDDTSYSVENADSPLQVDDDTYSFTII